MSKEMKIITRLFLVILAFPVVAESYVLDLGGLTLDLKENDVVKNLGEPREHVEIADHINLILKYENIDVYFSGEFMEGAYTESEKTCTP